MTDTYERVTYRPEGAAAGRALTVILRNPTERQAMIGGVAVRFVTGAEVDRFEDDKRRRHFIDASLVLRRVPLHLDRHYGELVPQDGGAL